MKLTIITRPRIEDHALKIRELAKHGTYSSDGIQSSIFSSIFESAEIILAEFKSAQATDGKPE